MASLGHIYTKSLTNKHPLAPVLGLALTLALTGERKYFHRLSRMSTLT
jgi:hypothetical protein